MRKRHGAKTFCAALLASIVWGNTAAAEQAPVPKDDKIVMDFTDVDLPVLIKFISEITGRAFVFDERVKGKITIVAPQKMSVDQAYAAFQSALYITGFATIPSGAVTKIVPVSEAKSSAIDTVVPSSGALRGERIITELFRLKNADVRTIVPTIQPLVSPDGVIAAYAATNTLLIVDNAANIDRLRRILDSLDASEPQAAHVNVLPLKNATVTELAPVLQGVLGE